MKLFLIVLFGLTLRLVGVFMAPDHFIFPDSTSYDKIAHNILQGNGFIQTESLKTVRPPIYPLFLAFAYACKCNIFWIRLIQVFINCASILLIYLLAKKLSKNINIALLSSFLFAIDPLQIVFCSLILTETIFSFLFLACLLTLHKCCECSSKKHAVLLGFIFAIGSLLRSVLFPFSFYICFFWWLYKKNWKLILLTLGTMLVVMSPWIIRNFFIYQSFIPTTTKTGVNLFEALGPGATGGPRMQKLNLPDKYRKLNEIQKDIFLRHETLIYLQANPSQFFSLAGIKFLRLWNPGLNDIKLRKYFINYGLIIFSMSLYICSISGMFYISRQNAFYLLLPVIYICFIHMVFIGSIRYRVPILPCLDIIASFAIINIFFKNGVD